MNNEVVYRNILDLFDKHHVKYALLHHPPCRTSEESAQARAGAGYPEAVGAKALTVKCEFIDRTVNATLVLPGFARLEGKIVKANIPGLKRFRFLTVDEMRAAVQLSPGCMPPFGPSIFPAMERLFVDVRLKDFSTIGFNAAHAERSIVVSLRDYLQVATPVTVVPLSEATDSSERAELMRTID
jgi:prolyl-tRNA editing enzyme YbaK/EbsC (Cys-tRNA(Pro) deacylase)